MLDPIKGGTPIDLDVVAGKTCPFTSQIMADNAGQVVTVNSPCRRSCALYVEQEEGCAIVVIARRKP